MCPWKKDAISSEKLLLAAQKAWKTKRLRYTAEDVSTYMRKAAVTRREREADRDPFELKTKKSVAARRGAEARHANLYTSEFIHRETLQKFTIPPEGMVVGDVAYIPLSRGQYAIVDTADLLLVSRYRWRVTMKGRSIFENFGAMTRGSRPMVMHRLITDAPPGLDVHHRDGDSLNNRHENLLVCTKDEHQRIHISERVELNTHRLIQKRIRAGLARAKAEGRRIGRPRKLKEPKRPGATLPL
jgi:hypothetical protein